MDETQRQPLPVPGISLAAVRTNLLNGLVILLLAGALLVLLITPALALEWTRAPFIGTFIQPHLVVSDLPGVRGDWSAARMGLRFPDQLTAVDGQSVLSSADLLSLVNQKGHGGTVELRLERRDGRQLVVPVTLQAMPLIDQAVYFYLPYLVGFTYLILSLWLFGMRRNEPAAQSFAILGAGTSVVLAAWFDTHSSIQLVMVWTTALGLIGGALVHLGLTFPRPRGFTRRAGYLRLTGYLLGALLVANALSGLAGGSQPWLYANAWRVLFLFDALALLFFLGMVVFRRMRTSSPIEDQQTRVVLWASGFSLLPALIWGLGNLLRLSFVTQLHFSIFFASLLIFFPVLAYAILRHRLGDTDLYLSRAMTYAVLAIIAGAGYALVVSGVSLLLNTMIAFDSPFLIGLLVFGLALAFDPMRQRALRTINTVFFRGTAASQEQTREFTNQLSQAVELDDINRLLRDFVERDLFPLRVHIYVYNQLTDLYEAAPEETTRPTTDIRFARGSGLVSLLSDPQTPSLYIGDADLFPEQLESERTRLQLLGAQLFIALPGQQRLAGWVALGPRRSGANYSSDDLNYLNALCEQAALAIERTQVMADKDRRVLEMNVLTRVAQGVNVTLDFDDILELIFAQTSQVMPTDDFAITLYYQETESWRHVFYVENDERLETQEEQLIPPGQGLERVVLQSRRFIMTDDYDRECRNARVLPAKQGIYAWMGVPLNAGAETIGVVSAASRDPVVLYTEEQRDILQAIADQAAGAIVKARLLEESERRARQLATLNEVAQGLSSTLDIDPLLKQILDSAVELLNCETGSLLTIDDETQEAVFAVVNGPVADKLLGTRLPLSEGLVGKAINERLPVVVNNVGRSDEWSESTDKKSGFETRGLLVVPMMVQDRVTGVIETLNKRDGQPFNQNDVELLMAFTAQAAVALENARLYTMTDQALTERVEELSVMGRIDRELNASLDVERAMRITLQWALRQSDSSAGLIGFVGEEGVRVIASERYHGELRAFGEDEIMLPRSLPIIEDVLNSGRYSAQPGASLRAGARSQIALPIRREEDIIGLLLLESNEVNPYTDDVISFLSRLSDHAAIAINNAQLYAEVQRANIAKSDFVSLVSHELKTPMTSIKGYADLLLAGAVGEVSEGQQNFLGTIRTNIDRMATLVSDLADVSRIEAGRLKIEFAPVELQSVIDEVLRSTHAQFEEKNQKLVLDIPPDLPAAWGDRNRIVQVLTNLVSNAHKYTNEGGSVTVRAAQSENLWDPQGASQVIRIAVEDTGIGIKEEDQKKIFTQYFRTQEGRDNAPGTGLGLNISRNLVEMQGGKIWFESVYGKGTTFLFTLPVADLTMVTPNEPA